MTIKITRDVNLDEKSIQIKDDKLTVLKVIILLID